MYISQKSGPKWQHPKSDFRISVPLATNSRVIRPLFELNHPETVPARATTRDDASPTAAAAFSLWARVGRHLPLPRAAPLPTPVPRHRCRRHEEDPEETARE